MKKILVGLALAVWIMIPFFTLYAAGQEGVPTNKNHQDKMISVQTSLLRHNVRMILRDHRFDYPDRLQGLKKLWHRIFSWFAKRKPVKRTVNYRVWQKVFLGLGFAGLIALLFLLIYSLPKKMFVHSGKLKDAEKIHQNAKGLPQDLRYQAWILAEQDQYREAIRLLYLAGLEFLQKKHFLPDSSLRLSDKANLQIIRNQFGLTHPGYRAFQELVLVFQEKWYGFHSCQIEDYRRLNENLKIMEATMGNPHG